MLTKTQINLSALKHNFEETRKLVGPGTDIFPVIKSDAYGHGLVNVGHVLKKAGADGFLVAGIEEAVRLREAGLTLPIIVHLPEPKYGFDIVEFNLIPVIYHAGLAEPLARQFRKRGRVVNAFVKVETGMGRLGISSSDLQKDLAVIKELEEINILGLMSHLSSADSNDRDYTLQQLDLFQKAIQTGRSLGLSLPKNHMANSAGLISYASARLDLVRPGIMIYGIYPSEKIKEQIPLKPAMTFKSEIVQISNLTAGASVSYGRSFVTSQPSRIAAVPVGYENGYSRLLSNRAAVLIKGSRAPVVGRICMCLTLVDVSHIEGVECGDEVVMFGRQGNEFLSVNEVAAWADTISYELLCAVGSRNLRVFEDEDQ